MLEKEACLENPVFFGLKNKYEYKNERPGMVYSTLLGYRNKYIGEYI